MIDFSKISLLFNRFLNLWNLKFQRPKSGLYLFFSLYKNVSISATFLLKAISLGRKTRINSFVCEKLFNQTDRTLIGSCFQQAIIAKTFETHDAEIISKHDTYKCINNTCNEVDIGSRWNHLWKRTFDLKQLFYKKKVSV